MNLDHLPLDGAGYLDMGQFPDDGTALADDAVADLHSTLLADPVDEPSDDDWAVLLDGALDDSPFEVDDDVAGFTYDRDAEPDDDGGADLDDDLVELDLGEADDLVGDDLDGGLGPADDDLGFDPEPEPEAGPDFGDDL